MEPLDRYPSHYQPVWVGMTDAEQFAYFNEKYASQKGHMTIDEHRAYDRVFKRVDPEGFAAKQAAIRVSLLKKQAMELTIEQLEEVIAAKLAGEEGCES